ALCLVIKQRKQQKAKRKKKELSVISIIGYTNAGKSTLFNYITDAGVLVEDKLFATLDSTAKIMELEKGKDIIISDTVGFISNLPHRLVASFKATLKDVQNADLLIHLVDFSDENFMKYIDEVQKVLGQIEADEIPQLLVLNKMDRADEIKLKFMKKAYPNSIGISAKTGMNIDAMIKMVDDLLHSANECELLIPHTEQKILNKLFKLAKILDKEYLEEGVKVRAIINQEDRYEFDKFLMKKDKG
ncbi:MAG: GTPase HflX, partial [Candidatus Cloacimonetes bacterium]|nr:GTPase HflX [Candidatus Cloacimonadota bacterium]